MLVGDVLPQTSICSDPDGDALTLSVVTGPSHGTVTIHPSNYAFRYTASNTYTGSDSFTYTATDAPGAVSSVGTATIQVFNTRTGSNVTVQPDPSVSITFGFVNSPGTTIATSSPTGPPTPAGFEIPGGSLYWEISTTAVFNSALVCIVAPTGVTNPRLLHNGVDVTTSLNGAYVCGNVTSLSPFVVAVPAPIDGRMYGNGHIRGGETHHHVVFRVSQSGNRDYGRFEYWARSARFCSLDDDDDHDGERNGDRDGEYGRDRRKPTAHFEATSITAVVFSDDPGFKPGRTARGRAAGTPGSEVDTVVFSGTGRWNGQRGFTFEAVATDRGEPGRRRDTFSLVVRNAAGRVVANINDALDGGNIQADPMRPPWRSGRER
jgi:hypothetical protein